MLSILTSVNGGAVNIVLRHLSEYTFFLDTHPVVELMVCVGISC